MGSSSRRRLCSLAVAAAILAVSLPGCSSKPVGLTVRATVPEQVAWRSSAKFGLWRDGVFDVFNNEWNTSAAGPQTVWADSYHHWGVVSTQADTTSVKTYPSVQENYYPYPALASVRRLDSSFSESMPPARANYDAEAAYDLWLDKYQIEVMVWVDNHGQTPAGGVVSQARISGQQFAVYEGSSHMFSLVLAGAHETSGTVDLLAVLRWLVNHGYLAAKATLTQVNFGWEVASTDNFPMGFTMRSYSLASSPPGG